MTGLNSVINKPFRLRRETTPSRDLNGMSLYVNQKKKKKRKKERKKENKYNNNNKQTNNNNNVETESQVNLTAYASRTR